MTSYTFWEPSVKEFYCELCDDYTGDTEHEIAEEFTFGDTNPTAVVCLDSGAYHGPTVVPVTQTEMEYVKRSLGVT